MILELQVENIAIIERARLTLGPGFTALTGETGAGKSLLIDAIGLALGGRADSDLVRAGAARGAIHMAIDISRNPAARALCEREGLATEDDQLFVHREVSAEGRSSCRIGGRLAPVGALRALGALVADLHGQHEHQSLLNPDTHRAYLDDWIGEPARVLVEEVARRHATWVEARERLAAAQRGLRDREQRLDLLRFQIDEIEAVGPVPGEMEEQEARLSRLRHAERLRLAAHEAIEAIDGDERSAVTDLGRSVAGLESAERLDPDVGAVLEPLRTALYLLQEGARALRGYAERVELDPETLEETAARIDVLRRLRRKYGEDERAVLAHMEHARRELAMLEEGEAGEAELAALVEREAEAIAQAAGQLSALRKQFAAQFATEVAGHLRDLAMERAVFEVDLAHQPIDATGADRVEYRFSANAGEPPRALARIASGGEMSRVMLAIKVALAGRAGVPTLIFDEVDAGLSGRAAAKVATKLEELAAHTQVVVISHLPQIAAKATSHYRIEKVAEGGRTLTQLRALSDDERVAEIARMLAGEEIGASALANARELLRR
jgi:DNA repair protein RecN (Recombination protein N)